ncbi:MAG TPA: hypothetical protein VM618_12060 [Acidimicrobiia bacterium]|nr:hypothetical protein [Acidimicrobiia bacterium]
MRRTALAIVATACVSVLVALGGTASAQTDDTLYVTTPTTAAAQAGPDEVRGVTVTPEAAPQAEPQAAAQGPLPFTGADAVGFALLGGAALGLSLLTRGVLRRARHA